MNATLEIEALDVTGQRAHMYRSEDPDTSIAQMVEDLVAEMDLPVHDAEGGVTAYQARRERDGRALNAAEKVRDTVVSGDRVFIEPDISAG
jgi:hypothetical protein